MTLATSEIVANAPVAQLEEQGPSKTKVAGSSPAGSAMAEKFRGKTRFWGLYRWYSICSRWHPSGVDPSCPLCMRGTYENRIIEFFDHLIYKWFYGIWYRWHNRPDSKDRRFLEETFPGLKGKK